MAAPQGAATASAKSGGVSTNAQVIFQGETPCLGSCASWSRNTKWLITSEFIERDKGFCCRTVDNVQLVRIKDISFNQYCCCNCCGTITIWSSDETNPILQISGLPNGREVFHKIRDAFEALHNGARIEIQA